jgi:pSer/pThr/pTyr-binding forkhead associated (FHA) protein
MFGGRLPRGAASSLQELLHRTSTEWGLHLLETTGARIPGDLEQVLRRCLPANPNERYTTTAELVSALDALDDDGNRIRTPLLPNRLRRLIEGMRGPRAAARHDRDFPIMTRANAPLPPARANAGDATLPGTIHPATSAGGSGDGGTIDLGAIAFGTHEPARPDAQLLITRSPDSRWQAEVVPIKKALFSIGRDPTCDLAIDDAQLSRRHASIDYQPGGFGLRDEGSSNGTLLDTRPVRPGTRERLPLGSTIQVGDTVLSFTIRRTRSLPDLTGRLLERRYELTKRLRDSPKGSVYSARDRTLDTLVAVKVIAPDLMQHEVYREQFGREVSHGASLRHPHICRVLNRGVEPIRLAGQLLEVNYLCLEMVAGGNLTERIRAGPCSFHDICDWVIHLADALDFVHLRGIVHGDVKPGAIVFDESGRIYLTDFAFAQRLSGEAGAPVFGAPAYVAPETWEHRSLTPRSDQFALAAVAYQLITNKLPFPSYESAIGRRKDFAVGPLPAHDEARDYRPDPVPPLTSKVLAKALAFKPDQRFDDASQFALALADALRGRLPRRAETMVFMSYQRGGSSGWVNYLAKELKEHGISAFVDVQRQDGAQQFPERLLNAIRECDVFVCLLGPKTLESAWVLEEIREAHRSEKPMIPIFHEGFNPSTHRGIDPAVDMLLEYGAVHLFEVQVEYAAEDLARRVKTSLPRHA